jgi:hypothetical protein
MLFLIVGTGTDPGRPVAVESHESTRQAMHAHLQLRDELLGLVVPDELPSVQPEPGPRSDVFREEQHV